MNEQLENQFPMFQFQQQIGQGSFGTVIKAFNTISNQIVAVKIIRKKSSEQCVQLLQEASILQELHHPNIVKFLGVYESENKILIEMELIRGGSLNTQNKYTEEQIKIIMYSIFQALQYMHNNNIAHRDLKPENILISSDLTEIKVSDFGLSTGYSSLMTKQCGTLTYMAPEQLNNRIYNKAVDVWAAGVIMYQLIVGCHPYYKKGCDIIKSQLEMHDLCKGNLNDAQFSLFRRLTDLNPSKRYSPTQALLHPWFNNGSEEPLTMEEQFYKWQQSQKLQNIIITLMLLAQLGYKKQLFNKQFYYNISNSINQRKKQDFINNYDQLFAEYQSSLTDQQKISNVTIKIEQNTTIDSTKVSHSTISNRKIVNQKSKITQQASIVIEDYEQESNIKLSQFKQEKIKQSIMVSSQHSKIPESEYVTIQQLNQNELQGQQSCTNTTNTSPTKSPPKKKRVKKIKQQDDLITQNIQQMQQIQMKPLQPPQRTETPSPNRFKIQLKPLNHPHQIQQITNFPLKPRKQIPDRETFAPPVLDLTNMALECISPKYRKSRANSLQVSKRIYANEFHPSRILGCCYNNYDTFYLK